MDEFYIKKGLADIELKNWIEDHKDEDFIRVQVEVESTDSRLRRSFHALINAWFDCGEWSANGATIYTYEKLRTYYKLEGCEGVPDFYLYKNDKFKTLEKVLEVVPKNEICFVGKEKSWGKMNKKQKSNALNCLLKEISYSMTNNQKVLSWVAKITGDIIMLNDINYHKNIK